MGDEVEATRPQTFWRPPLSLNILTELPKKEKKVILLNYWQGVDDSSCELGKLATGVLKELLWHFSLQDSISPDSQCERYARFSTDIPKLADVGVRGISEN